MSSRITPRKVLLPIVALFLPMYLASAVPGAEEGALIRDSIIKEGAGMKNIQVYTIRNSGGWALAILTYEEDGRATRGGSALLKKSGPNWKKSANGPRSKEKPPE